MEKLTIPVLSTSHLCQRTAEILTELGQASPWVTCAAWEHGFFLELGGYLEDAPLCIRDLYDWIIANGFNSNWVCLDQGVAPIDDLPSYIW